MLDDAMNRRRLALALEIVAVGAIILAAVALRLRLMQHWVVAGSDSYGYLGIADEWRRAHRFAFGPPPAPLEWYRRPLYPLFLIVARGDAPALMTGGPGWKRIEIAQLIVEAGVLWPLLYAAARRLGGRVAALVSLLLAAFYLPAVVFPLAVLTESLAMTLTVVAIAPLLLWRDTRPRLAYALAGAGVALSSLLRPDGILLAAAFLPLVFVAAPQRRARAQHLAIASVTFVLLFAGWPLRNVIEFGSLHLTDGMIDRAGNEIPNYRGFWDWMRTWSVDEKAAGFPASCFYDEGCDAGIGLYDGLGAFAAPARSEAEERATVARLLEERRRSGLSPAISTQLEALARARRNAHPFRVLIALPIRRTIRAWWAPQSELVENSATLPQFFQAYLRKFKRYGRELYIATILAILILLIVPATRLSCLVVVIPLLARSFALGWTGFSLPRYVAPSYPLCYLLIGCGIAQAVAYAKNALRARSAAA